MTSRRLKQRGFAMVVVLILVVVLTILGLAAIHFSGTENGGVSAFKNGEQMVACAEAGRQVLLGSFDKLATPVNLKLSTQLEAADPTATCPSSMPAGSHCLMGGHVDQTGTSVTAVNIVPSGASSGQRNQRDLTNVSSRFGLGSGEEYEVVVHCKDGAGRQSEVEYLLRFGF